MRSISIRYPFAVTISALAISTGSALARGDYNGDGKDDLAVGSPMADSGGIVDVGVVDIFLGTAAGLAHQREIWQNEASPTHTFAANARFGTALANGDFNGDGRTDLAIGAPGTTVEGAAGAGAVHIAHGSFAGPILVQTWTQNSPGIADHAESNDRFGNSLTAGDFDGDGFDDLAIGVLENVNGYLLAGAVHVLYGSKKGLVKSRDQFWHQDKAKLPSTSATGEAFGYGLCSGDWNADGFEDLAIGIPKDDFDLSVRVGAIQVLWGTKNGLRTKNNRYLTAAAFPGDPADISMAIGGAMITADLNGDNVDDLVVGAPGANVDGEEDVGAVFVVLGSSDTDDVLNSMLTIFQGMPSIAGGDEPEDHFGFSLAAGDVDRNGLTDLIVGVPGEDAAVDDEGTFRVLLNEAGKPFPAYGKHLNQSVFGASQEVGDAYGHAIAMGDFTGDGAADVVVSSVLEDTATIPSVGGIG
jgi:hypothetical protein